MTRRWPRSRAAKIAIFLLVTIAAAILLWSWTLRRDGLFNNVPDRAQALAAHQRAWLAQGRRNDIPRLDLLMMTRTHDGECLTSEANWVAVALDLRLDPALLDGAPLIECRFKVRGRLSQGLFPYYVWTLFLKADGPEHLQLVEARRQSTI